VAQLSVTLVGRRLRNPLVLAAGILGLSADGMLRVFRSGIAAVTTKSFSLNAWHGNPNPVVADLGFGLLNAVGLANPGAQHMIREITTLLRNRVPVIASIFGTSLEELEVVGRLLRRLPLLAVELNVSCPHVKEVGGTFVTNYDLLRKAVRVVARASGKPVIVKLPAEPSRIIEMAEAAEDGGAAGFTATNTIAATDIDVELVRPVLSVTYGGMSGPALRPIALACVYTLYEVTEKPIIGCGGVESWVDAVKFILSGARCVGIGTAFSKEQPEQLVPRILSGIRSYMRRHGYGSIEEMIGAAHKR